MTLRRGAQRKDIAATVYPQEIRGARSKLAFETELTLNRKDYGLTWNAALGTGGFLWVTR